MFKGTKIKRLHAEIAAAVLSGGACIGTLVEPQWFERLFDEAPDAGDGSLETIVAVAVFAVCCVVFSGRAFVQARHAARLQAGRPGEEPQG